MCSMTRAHRRAAAWTLRLASLAVIVLLAGCNLGTSTGTGATAGTPTATTPATATATTIAFGGATATPGTDATATPGTDATATPGADATATATPITEATPVPPTATPVPPPPPTATPRPQPTATPRPQPTATPAPPPSVSGTVVASFAGNVMDFQASNGAINWSTVAIGPDQPVTANGNVYSVTSAGFLSTDGYIREWNAASGYLQWEYHTGDDLYGPAIAGSLVVAAANEDGLWAIRSDGSLAWHNTFNRAITSSAPVATSSVIYVNIGDTVFAVNASDGSIKWQFNAPSVGQTSPVLVNGTLYAGPANCSSGLCVYALNANTGAQEWSAGVGNGFAEGSHSLVVANNTVYALTSSGVYALAAGNGGQQWSVSVFAGGYFLVDGSQLYIENNAGALSAISLTSRATDWTLQKANAQFSLMALGNGIVYVGENDTDSHAEYTYGLRTSNGGKLWTQQIAAPQPTPTP